jgi:uncharacterized protein (TIGR00730 family)
MSDINTQTDPTKPVINKPESELPIKPLTLERIERTEAERLLLIDREFKQGFDYINSIEKSVTFFGSARFDEHHHNYKKARHLAERISQELGYTIVTGGGPGIMEAANRGAYETGGTSVGFTIELPHEQVRNPYLTSYLDFYYFFSRKVLMSFAAEAYVFFPGGFGTLDEFFEIITLVQTKKIQDVPVILVGNDFWGKLDTFIKEELSDKLQTIDDIDRSLYTITEDEDQILEIIKGAQIRK